MLPGMEKFMNGLMDNQKQVENNLDVATVKSFGDKWTRFDQSELPSAEANRICNEYFAVFQCDLPKNASSFNMWCGSGRYAKFMAPRVAHLYCIDHSSFLEVAKLALSSAANVSFFSWICR